ncbi:MAG TPA: rod-binding protein [Planctomycetota bacterium]|nr:rod-binding protein [Planctomycetota bacterium]
MDVGASLPEVPAIAQVAHDQRLGAARRELGRGEVGDAAREFERLFATLLVKEMRSTLPEGFFGGGAGSDVFDGWFDEHLGASLAEGRGLGLRIALERDLGLKQTAVDGEGSQA